MGNIRILLLVLIAAFATVFLPAFLGAQGNVAVDKDSNGERVALRVGQYLEVRLAESGSTGYTWHVLDLDQSMLESSEMGAAPKSKGGSKVGTPVLKTWRFKALAKGETNLRMQYYRSWEGPEKSVDSFQIRLVIR